MTHIESRIQAPLETASLARPAVESALPAARTPRALCASRRSLRMALVIGIAALACERRSPPAEIATPSVKPAPKSTVPALDVSLVYPSIQSVGATKRIHWEKTAAVDAHSPPDAWKITFEASGDFAGICWKNKPGNEGEAPGDDLSKGGYRRISFWAKGALGGEAVEFRAGGLGNVKTRHSDSFDVSAGRLRLTPAWKEYGLYVTNADLSSVMTPFCVLLHREDNPGEAVIYLDDIEYRG